MTVFSLLYVSHSLLQLEEREAEIADIVQRSLARNAREEITGALFYTGRNFAQILEGSEQPIQAVMADILRDSRHDNVDVVDTRLQRRRDFPSWSLAYEGGATYMQKHIERLLRPSPHVPLEEHAIRSMRQLMIEQVAAYR